MQEKVIRINESKDYKVVAISDVHGHYDVLERLVDRLELASNDYLIILGDFINKGIDSYRTYEYIRELDRRDRTFVLKGNHEYLLGEWMRSENEFTNAYDIILRGFGRDTIVHSILKRHQLDIDSFSDGKKLYQFLLNNYDYVFGYFRQLPIVLHFNDFIFTHGRYDEEFILPEDEYKYLKYYGYDTMKANEQKVIVGHWPVANFYPDEKSNAPYFDNKNYIFIDGGMGVFKDGQLNAFIINSKDREITYSFMQEDNLS